MVKQIDARTALSIVNRELIDLHNMKRQQLDEISCLQQQVRILREEKEDQAYRLWLDTLTWKVITFYTALVAFAALVW